MMLLRRQLSLDEPLLFKDNSAWLQHWTEVSNNQKLIVDLRRKKFFERKWMITKDIFKQELSSHEWQVIIFLFLKVNK